MNFKNWLISEEIYAQNNTATVYHRTNVDSVSNILTSDFKSGAGKGCWYGCGLYTTYKIESQFTDYMKMYGEALVKFTVTDLDKYLIFELSEAKKIHGNDYKISSQLKKFGLLNKVTKEKFGGQEGDNLKYYDELQEKETYSAILAKKFYDQNDWIEKSIKGIVYYGANDGYCLVKYQPVQDETITMLGYAVAEADANDKQKMKDLKNNIGWITSTDKASMKSIYKSPNREKFSFGYNYEIGKSIFNKLLNSKNLEAVAKYLGSNLNELSDFDVSLLIKKSTDKDKMAEVIIKYKTKLSDTNVKVFLKNSTKQNKIAELIIKYKAEISHANVVDLLQTTTDKDKMMEVIINKKTNFSSSMVQLLLHAATDKNKIAELIVNKKIEFSDADVDQLLHAATDKDKMAQMINKYHTKKTPEIQKIIDRYI